MVLYQGESEQASTEDNGRAERGCNSAFQFIEPLMQRKATRRTWRWMELCVRRTACGLVELNMRKLAGHAVSICVCSVLNRYTLCWTDQDKPYIFGVVRVLPILEKLFSRFPFLKKKWRQFKKNPAVSTNDVWTDRPGSTRSFR